MPCIITFTIKGKINGLGKNDKNKSPKVKKKKENQELSEGDSTEVEDEEERGTNSSDDELLFPKSLKMEESEFFDENDKNSLHNFDHKTWRIYGCRALGPDRPNSEPWNVSTSGFISLDIAAATGFVHWNHDPYNRFKGPSKITIPFLFLFFSDDFAYCREIEDCTAEYGAGLVRISYVWGDRQRNSKMDGSGKQ